MNVHGACSIILVSIMFDIVNHCLPNEMFDVDGWGRTRIISCLANSTI